jgi:hypothetical protein
LNVVPTFIYLSQDNTLIQTEIGQFDVKVIDQFLNIGYQRGLVPLINMLLSDGFPIPSIQHLTIENPQIVWGNR